MRILSLKFQRNFKEILVIKHSSVYHLLTIDLYNFKNMKNTHGGALLLVKLQAKARNFTESNTPRGRFSLFLNCTNDTKSRKASHIPVLNQFCYTCFMSLLQEYGNISNKHRF